MSCYKCGRDLPDAQTECDPPCAGNLPVDMVSEKENVSRQLDVDGAIERGEMIVLQFSIMPDKELLSDPATRAQFDLALFQWLRAIGANFISTGLHKFCKREDSTEGNKGNEE